MSPAGKDARQNSKHASGKMPENRNKSPIRPAGMFFTGPDNCLGTPVPVHGSAKLYCSCRSWPQPLRRVKTRFSASIWVSMKPGLRNAIFTSRLGHLVFDNKR